MHYYPLTELGNPILRAKAKPLPPAYLKTAAFKKLVKDMFYTMHRAQGVGLVAPQIGKSIQLAVIEVRKTKHRSRSAPFPRTVLVNPVITWRSKELVHSWEGCLSFKDLRGLATRHKEIKVSYLDEKGKKISRKLKDFPAIVFQHEIDHLNGHVYLDRVADMRAVMTLNEFKKRITI